MTDDKEFVVVGGCGYPVVLSVEEAKKFAQGARLMLLAAVAAIPLLVVCEHVLHSVT